MRSFTTRQTTASTASDDPDFGPIRNPSSIGPDCSQSPAAQRWGSASPFQVRVGLPAPVDLFASLHPEAPESPVNMVGVAVDGGSDHGAELLGTPSVALLDAIERFLRVVLDPDKAIIGTGHRPNQLVQL